MDAIGSATQMIIDAAVDTMAKAFGGNSQDTNSSFVQLIKNSDDASAGDLIKQFFDFEECKGQSESTKLCNSDLGSDPVAIVLSIINLLPSINLAGYLGGTGSPLSAILGVVLASIGFLSSVFSWLMPIYLDTLGVGASVIGFLGVLEPILNPKGTLLANPYADAILLGWRLQFVLGIPLMWLMIRILRRT